MKLEEKITLLHDLVEMEEKTDFGNLTRFDRSDFQAWVSKLIDRSSDVPLNKPEIVRCEFCVHYVYDKTFGQHWCTSRGHKVRPNEYCSKGTWRLDIEDEK